MILSNVVITAYCACHFCCGKNTTGKTASGTIPIEGRTIAVSHTIPFGTRIEIDGHTYTVEDRLARRYDNRIDIFFTSHKTAKNFGIKTNTVIIK